MRAILGFLLLASLAPATAQVTKAQAFSPDEIAIYRELLLHYPLQPGDLFGMQPTTVAFNSRSLGSSLNSKSELSAGHMIARAHTVAPCRLKFSHSPMRAESRNCSQPKTNSYRPHNAARAAGQMASYSPLCV